MSNDSFTEDTTQSFGSRIKGALAGIVIGPLIICLSCSFLWSNEVNNAHMIDGLKEGKASYHETKPDRIDPSLENLLIHISGNIMTNEILKDIDFGLSIPAIKLQKNVETYQWDEEKRESTHDNYGGSSTTTTTYTYSKKWSNTPISSSNFKESGHTNPVAWKYNEGSMIANTTKIGGYTIITDLVNSLTPKDTLDIAKYSPKIHSGEVLSGNSIYVGKDALSPEIGDQKISFTVINNNTPVSILGKQMGDSIGSYVAKSGSNITRIEIGNKSAAEMFQSAEKENSMMTWIFRIGGILFIFIGFSVFLSILPMLAAIIPPLSWIIDAGVSLISLILTIILGGSVIVLAWFAYRPVLSIIVLIITTFLAGGVYYKIHQKKNPPQLGENLGTKE